jgi:hypothetical protein
MQFFEPMNLVDTSFHTTVRQLSMYAKAQDLLSEATTDMGTRSMSSHASLWIRTQRLGFLQRLS